MFARGNFATGYGAFYMLCSVRVSYDDFIM
jgi:hypothetical protein